jgi:dihydrofolate synthase/folylpolyglutamate synthase
VEQARGDISLSYFEFGTLAALAAFAEAQAEVAVLEVGMGGRLDAVNIVDPDVSVITSIGLDHQAWLGNTREAIAREKAGILRPGRVGVCADPDPPHTLVGAARRLGAALQRIGYEVGIEHHGHSWNWRWGEHVLAGLPQPALPGGHQRRNAAAALTALYALPRIHIERHAIEQALRDLAVPGRFQVMPGPVETVLDVAHNPQSAEALARVLRARPAGGRTLAVFAALADKDIEGIVDPLVGLISGWALSAPRAERALSAADLAARVTPRLGGGAPGVHAGVRDAYAAARAEARPGDRVLVFGSFYTVAEVLTEFV